VLQTGDILAIIRFTGYAAIFVSIWPPLLRPLLLVGAFLLLFFERRGIIARKIARSPSRRMELLQQQPIWSRLLPGWVAWFLVAECAPLAGEALPLGRRVYLEATPERYSFRPEPSQRRRAIDLALSIAVIILCVLPNIAILTPSLTQPLFLAIAGGACLAQLCLVTYTFKRYLRAELSDIYKRTLIDPFPKTRTFYSYLPSETPAFARTNWRGRPEIYLNARLQVPERIIRALLAHEQGHIAMGHVRLLFLLRCCRVAAIVIALIALVAAGSLLQQSSGPAAALALLVWVGLLIAPEAVSFLMQGPFERQADS
jgi:Zn-dependent protease with chaperone function